METMDTGDKEENARKAPPIYIVSGGSGRSGEHVVQTVLVQFPETNVPLIKRPHVRKMEQIEEILNEASGTGGTIVHTLVVKELRDTMNLQGKERNIATIDLMGPLFDRLSDDLGQESIGSPGLYRKLHSDYFERIHAIEFAVGHDDSRKHQDLPLADIVLIGPSRSGKTALGMYLGVLGWKVSNLPLIPGTPLPQKFFEVDRRRVIGLIIDLDSLIEQRRRREKRMSVSLGTAYTDPKEVLKELEEIKKIYRKHRFHMINVTHRPIESSADEIIERIMHYFR